MEKKNRRIMWGLLGLSALTFGLGYGHRYGPDHKPPIGTQAPRAASVTTWIHELGIGHSKANPSYFANKPHNSHHKTTEEIGSRIILESFSEAAPYYRWTPILTPAKESRIYRLGGSTADQAIKGATSKNRALDPEEAQFLNSSLSHLLRSSGKKSEDHTEELESDNPFRRIPPKETPEAHTAMAEQWANNPAPPPVDDVPQQPVSDGSGKGIDARPVLRFFGSPEPGGPVKLIEAHALDAERFGLARYGVGRFDFAVQPDYITSKLSVAIGDINNDGITDLIVADRVRNSITVLIGRGDQTYQEVDHFQIGYSVMSVALADVNGDGHLDLIVASTAYNNITVILGNGRGALDLVHATSFRGPPHVTTILTSDINGDGIPDITLLDLGRGIVMHFLGDGTGRFSKADLPDVVVEVQSIPTPDWFAGTRVASIEWVRRANSVSLNANYGRGVVESIANYIHAPNRFVGLGDFGENGHVDMAIGTLLELTRP